MPWSEPGSNNKDPWGGGDRKRRDQGPPDLDELLKKLKRIVVDFLGGKKSPTGGHGGSGKWWPNAGKLLWLIVPIAVVGYLYKAVYVVDEKERAVILRFGKYLDTVGPGLHIYCPPIDQKLQRMVTEYKIYRLNQEMLTQDENIVQVALSVQYNISDLRDYELNVASPVRSLEGATQSALRHVVGSSTMHGVLTEGRETLATEVKMRLQEYLNNYGTGLAISRVNVESAQPPKQVQVAFDDVIRAREDEERLKNKAYAYSNQVLPEARGKARAIVERASAYKEEVVALAEGRASRFTSVRNVYELAPKVMRERLYLDAMRDILSSSSKVIISNKGSGNIFYLPLDKLMQSTANASSQEKNDSSTLPAQGALSGALTSAASEKTSGKNTGYYRGGSSRKVNK